MPDDQRLIALADVRDLTVVRDDRGHVTGLPQIERTLDACLDSLRSARSADRELAKLDWNRVQLYVWPALDAPLAELDEVIRSLAPRTGALGLEQVLVQFRAIEDGAESRELMLRMSRPPGAGLTLRITDPPPQPLRELNAYTQNVIRARRRGTVYPYELIPLITRSPDPGGAPGTFTEYDLDEHRGAGAGGPGSGRQHRQSGPGCGQHPDQALPGGDAPGGAAGRPDPRAGGTRRAGMPPGTGGPGAGAAPARPGGVVRHLGGRQDRDGLRHRDHGLDLPGPPRDHRVHPGRRRDQRRGHRHQRRRSAVLERRGHDAHAHPGHPGHDPGFGHGADREAVARLFRRGLGRGQLRHRRLRPDHGPERRGPVLGARPVQRGRRAAGALRARVRGRGRPLPAGGPDQRPRQPGYLGVTARRSGLPCARRDLRLRPQPGAQEALRHALAAVRGDRRRLSGRWSGGPTRPTRHRCWCSTRTWAGSR